MADNALEVFEELSKPPGTRSDFCFDVNLRWQRYVGGLNQVDGFPTDELDQVLYCAVGLVRLVHSLHHATQTGDVRLADMEAEAAKTEGYLKAYRSWDRFAIRLGGEYHLFAPLEDLQGSLVKRARGLGLPWRRIGDALGMSPAGIFKKAREKGWTYESVPEESIDDYN